MLLVCWLAASLLCLLTTADDIASSGNVSDSAQKRTFGEVQDTNSPQERHHIEKRIVRYGLNFVCTGYNYLKGNPDGGRSSHGGIDPGILTTRRHIKLSATSSSDNPPPEVEDSTQSACVTHSTNKVFHGTKSYQSNLKVEASVSASGSYGLADFAFSASTMYEEARQETINTKSVVLDVRTVCNRGRLRFKKELAEANGYSVDDGFAAAVCALPTTYDQTAYMNFINDWGTHTIIQAELGTKTVERSKSRLKELFQYAMSSFAASVSASGGYGGYSASLDMNLNTLSSSSTFTSNFKQTMYSFTLGSDSHPEPIGFILEPIPAVLTATYWKQLNNFVTRNICPAGSTYSNRIAVIRTNVERALRNYPVFLQATPATDLPLKMPLVWPFGTYGLVMPRTGCPTSPAGILFHGGWRYHDTEDDDSNNYFSHGLQLQGSFNSNNLRWHFCIKTVASFTDFDLGWQKGEYCILKKGECPRGFTEGSLKWDDEDDSNANALGGVLPDGSYYRDTVINFCCRTDGHSENPIYLPTSQPFILMMKDDTCQQVHGMNVQKQYVRWDDEDDDNANSRTGSYPYDDGGNENHRLYFCYYTKA